MKKIIKKSTTITEMIENDEGKRYIINRKYDVNISTEPADRFNFLTSENEVHQGIIEKDAYFREEIAKEATEYKKNNPSPQKEKELLDASRK